MSIATDVSRIKGNITAALAAIADKGVIVPDGSTSDALAGLIASIEAGGGVDVGGRRCVFGIYTPASDSSGSQVKVANGEDIFQQLGIEDQAEYNNSNYVAMYWDILYPDVVPESNYSALYAQCILGEYTSPHYYLSSSSTASITRGSLINYAISLTYSNGLKLNTFTQARFRGGRSYAWMIIER